MDLALDDHRIDADAAIIDRDHAADFHLPRATVDVDDHQVGTERIRHFGRVVVSDTLESGLHPVRKVGVGGEGDLLDGLRFRWRPSHEEPALVELDVGLGGLEQMSSDLLGLVAELAADHGGGRATDRGAAAGVGAQPVRRIVGIALLNLNIGRRDAQLAGNDLSERSLVTLALALDPKLENRLAGRMYPQLR